MNETEAKTIASGSFRNRGPIMSARACGCFHCLATFKADEIRDWVDDDQTALCPRCGVDSVLADVIDAAILQSLHHFRFDVFYRFDATGTPVRVAGE